MVPTKILVAAKREVRAFLSGFSGIIAGMISGAVGIAFGVAYVFNPLYAYTFFACVLIVVYQVAMIHLRELTRILAKPSRWCSLDEVWPDLERTGFNRKH